MIVKNKKYSFYWLNIGIPIICAFFILIAFDFTNLDLVISNLFVDPKTNEFIFRYNDLFEKITHKWPRFIPNWTGEFVIISFLASFIWGQLESKKENKFILWLKSSFIAKWLCWAKLYRKDLFYIVVSFLLTTTVIHYLKSHTGIYCPVETTLYGGTHAHIEWFNRLAPFHRYSEGRCWPGGHASAGFTMLALYFVARHHGWKYSKQLLAFCLILGMVFGMTRVMQGWHFVSHNLWSGVIVWLVMFLLALGFYGREGLSKPIKRK